MSRSMDGLVRSVQVRLVRHAKDLNIDPNLVLTRFAIERFLYRLSRSLYADRFVLKGALLILAWLGETVRPTRDADLLGFGELSDESLSLIFREVCEIAVEKDAMVFLAETVRIAAIRPEDAYGGKRVTIQARLGPARLRVQVDVGIGDSVTPEPEWQEYPTLLDLPRPKLRCYQPETVIAEKFHAMVVLGSKNSRMRDFFDIDVLAQRRSFDGHKLAVALQATFERRKSPLPLTLPLALTREFSHSQEKAVQWRAFITKNGLRPSPEDLAKVVDRIATFLEPVLEIARGDAKDPCEWPEGGPWRQITKTR